MSKLTAQFDLTIAEWILTVRRRLRYSQAEFAAKLHLSRATIDRYESGRSEPGMGVLVQIAAIAETELPAFANR
jgi:transcriptional regulator with XRE-family HTH domain